MKKKTAMLLSALILFITLAVQAQDQEGTISGTVFLDANQNGLCANEGEQRLNGISLEFVNDDIQEIVRTTSGSDGTFTLTTTDLGLWQVTVTPGSAFRVSSQQSIDVLLSADTPEATDINFCLIRVQDEQEDNVTLPESGAVISPSLFLAAAIGLALIALGTALLIVRRYTDQ